MPAPNVTVKCVVVGDGAVGKVLLFLNLIYRHVFSYHMLKEHSPQDTFQLYLTTTQYLWL